jgi:hypothetical protein
MKKSNQPNELIKISGREFAVSTEAKKTLDDYTAQLARVYMLNPAAQKSLLGALADVLTELNPKSVELSDKVASGANTPKSSGYLCYF